MNIIEANKSFYSNYANFGGRATRSEYWWVLLSIILLSSIIPMIDERLHLVYALASLVPAFAVAWRRNNDAGFSGWWALLPLVCLYVAAQPSKQEA